MFQEEETVDGRAKYRKNLAFFKPLKCIFRHFSEYIFFYQNWGVLMKGHIWIPNFMIIPRDFFKYMRCINPLNNGRGTPSSLQLEQYNILYAYTQTPCRSHEII